MAEKCVTLVNVSTFYEWYSHSPKDFHSLDDSKTSFSSFFIRLEPPNEEDLGKSVLDWELPAWLPVACITCCLVAHYFVIMVVLVLLPVVQQIISLVLADKYFAWLHV